MCRALKTYWCVVVEFEGKDFKSARIYDEAFESMPQNNNYYSDGNLSFKAWFKTKKEAREYLKSVEDGK